MHGFGDAEQQICIERGLAEHLVEMVAAAMDFARQPAHAALVFAQLLSDEISDVDIASVSFHGFKNTHMKPSNFHPFHPFLLANASPFG